jgi:hypothetical protein
MGDQVRALREVETIHDTAAPVHIFVVHQNQPGVLEQLM